MQDFRTGEVLLINKPLKWTSFSGGEQNEMAAKKSPFINC